MSVIPQTIEETIKQRVREVVSADALKQLVDEEIIKMCSPQASGRASFVREMVSTHVGAIIRVRVEEASRSKEVQDAIIAELAVFLAGDGGRVIVGNIIGELMRPVLEKIGRGY